MEEKFQIKLFDDLIRNAKDFFERSLSEDEINDYPKYSLINFVSGVELILKARLVYEHWSLILDNPAQADISKFKCGDFRSINITTAIDRINNIIGEKISKQDFGEIEYICKQRNKLVHFHVPEYMNRDNSEHEKKVQEVIKEKCRCWLRLKTIINNKWKEIFSNFIPNMNDIDQTIKMMQRYLEVKYDEVKPTLDQRALEGIIINECNSCGYKAFDTSIEAENIPSFHNGQCKVCDNKSWVVILMCDKCNQPILHYGDDEDIACACGERYDVIRLIESNFDICFKDEHCEDKVICTECEHSITCEKTNNKYQCLFCFSEFENIEECGYCSQKFATDNMRYLEGSEIFGCMNCPGSRSLDD